MIDRVAIEQLYHDYHHVDEISCFYQLLTTYTIDHQTKKIEECLHSLNLLSSRYKIRPVYYDNHSLTTDLDRYIVETWRLERMEKTNDMI